MGVAQSKKNSPRHASKYEPRESTTPDSRHQKKRGNGSSKSTPTATAPPLAQSGSKKRRSTNREGEREGERVGQRPPPPSERKLPVVPPPHQVPPRSTRTHSHTTKTPSYTHPPTDRSHERNTTSLPSRQFSLTKQTSSGSMGSSDISSASKHAMIEKYFNLYKDNEEDLILAEGMEKFCTDLNVDPTEFIVLVLAWKFEASEMCRFTREEFINGCKKMKAYDANSLQDRFPELLQDARGKQFKDLYQFTFSFGLDHSTGQRSLPVDMAISLWELVFTQEKPVILERWFAFLREGDVRGISRDTWNMFLPFCHNVAPDLSNYDESEAWPSLFDDFVECELSHVQ